jgi:hypothetical protein
VPSGVTCDAIVGCCNGSCGSNGNCP